MPSVHRVSVSLRARPDYPRLNQNQKAVVETNGDHHAFVSCHPLTLHQIDHSSISLAVTSLLTWDVKSIIIRPGPSWIRSGQVADALHLHTKEAIRSPHMSDMMMAR